MKKNNIVFFDGVCNVCDKTVDFILKYDKDKMFSFASLQSDFAQDFFLEHKMTISLDTIVVFKDGIFLKRSKAMLFVLTNLKGHPRFLAAILNLSPYFFTDFFYALFAKNRYRFFGKKDVCKVPSKEVLSRFYE
jgi:predicted DCC family thiol-disulfide oxidoreductase YuxK